MSTKILKIPLEKFKVVLCKNVFYNLLPFGKSKKLAGHPVKIVLKFEERKTLGQTIDITYFQNHRLLRCVKHMNNKKR